MRRDGMLFGAEPAKRQRLQPPVWR
jgi:hypothetical protein